MLDASYQAAFKVLGKFCLLYDNSTSNLAAQNLLLARTTDQIATGEVASTVSEALFASQRAGYAASITAGPAALQAQAKSMASAYLTSSEFRAYLVTNTPTTPSSATSVLTAFNLEMAAGTDDKTLSTETTSGLINFFEAITGTDLTWNMEDDSTADYKDSVYVVVTDV